MDLIPAAIPGFPERKFKLIQDIKSGSHGEVLIAEALQWKNENQKFYALKKQKSISLEEEQIIQKIIYYQQNEEVKGQPSQLVKIFDFFKHKEEIFLVMELGDQDLHQFLVSQSMIDQEQKFRIMKQICISIQFLHQILQSLHRDIKPENFIKVGDQFKLIDFGTVRYNTFNQKTSQIGTILYQAPEMILGNGDYTQAVDIWSLGCVFYEFFSKEALFIGKNFNQVKQQISDCLKNQNLVSEKIKQLQVCEQFKNLLLQMLQPFPEKRLKIDQIIQQLNFISPPGQNFCKNQFQNQQSTIKFSTNVNNNQFQAVQFTKFLQDCSQQLENQQKEQKKFQEEIITYLNNQNIEQQFKNLQTQNQQLQQNYKAVTQEFTDLKNEFKNDLVALKKELSEKIDQINEHQIILKNQKQEIDDLKENKALYEKNESKRNQKIQEQELQIIDLNNQIQFIKKNEQELMRKQENQEKSFTQEIQEKQNQIESLKKQNESSEEQNKKLQQKIFEQQQLLQFQNMLPFPQIYGAHTLNVRDNYSQLLRYPDQQNQNIMQYYQKIQELQKINYELKCEQMNLNNIIKNYENRDFDTKINSEIISFRIQLQTLTHQDINPLIKSLTQAISYFFDSIENHACKFFDNHKSNVDNLLELVQQYKLQLQDYEYQNLIEKANQLKEKLEQTKNQFNKNRQYSPSLISTIKI